MNLRANVDDGKVTKDGDHKYADGDMHKGEKTEHRRRRLYQFGEGRQGDGAVQYRRAPSAD
jgi:hypothetical protein